MDQKKELKQKYKEMKPPMGVYKIENTKNHKVYVHAAKDTISMLNRIRFQLQMGVHPVKEMQEDWKKYGEEAFVFEVLEGLKYDEKEEKKDYTEELEILKMIWMERLQELGVTALYTE